MRHAIMHAAMLLLPVFATQAQEAPAAPQAEQRREANDNQRRSTEQLPAPVSSEQSIMLGDRRLAYTVMAGSIDLRDPEGRLRAEIAYTAYTLKGADGIRRPVTFAFNGGPGASSAYLHLAALGPRRLDIGNQGDGPSKPSVLVDNPETWLTFTDLVFIDPPGTGYSRIAGGDDAARQFYSVDGDVNALARVITRWLSESSRLQSPKYLVGESYGGFRVPKIASRLQTGEGVGVDGMVLLSPVLDFGLRISSDNQPLGNALRLPSMAATALEQAGKPVTRQALADVETYALTDYVTDQLRGPRDEAARERMVQRVAQATGLPVETVRKLGGRIDMNTFLREAYRGRSGVGSAYDGAVVGIDPDPFSARSGADDPVLDVMTAPLTSAAIAYTRDVIGWKPEGRYELLSRDVNRRWNWGSGINPPESASDLRGALALDPKLKALVVHGFTDIVTPYMESKLVLDQLPPFAVDRVRLDVYPGGHMFYSRDESRRAFRDAAGWLYGEAGR